MSAWSSKSETRDPAIIAEEKETLDCAKVNCTHLSIIFGRQWCEVRQVDGPYNFHCQFYREKK